MNQPESTPAARDAETRVDVDLRQTLDPDQATVRRVVRQALEQTSPAPAGARPWRLAAVAAALVLAAISLSLLVPKDPRPPGPSPSETATAEPAALQISNRGGLVTVTTPAGSKMVLLPIIPQPGDAS